MDIEQIKPNRPSFGLVALMAAAALLVILIAAVVLLRVRNHDRNKAPYSKTPTAMLVVNTQGASC